MNIYNDVPKDVRGLIDEYLVMTIHIKNMRSQKDLGCIKMNTFDLNKTISIPILGSYSRLELELVCDECLIGVIPNECFVPYNHNRGSIFSSRQLFEFYNKNTASHYKIVLTFRLTHQRPFVKNAYGEMVISVTKQMHKQTHKQTHKQIN